MPLKIPQIRQRPNQRVALKDLSGGANIKASRFAVPPNQFTKLINFMLVEDGSLIGRRGTVRWNATSLGVGAVQGASRGYFAGSNQFLAALSGTISVGTDSTQTFATGFSGWNATSPVWFWQYLNFVYLSNKTDPPRKYDGTTFTLMGNAAPTSASTVAVGAAGTPNGTYTVIVTFLTATLESNGSPASALVTVVNQNINVSAIPLGPAGTTARGMYGFKTNVSSVYQRIGLINDNTTTTFTITTDQSSWTTTLPTTNNPPTTGPYIKVLFKNRLWSTGDPANPQRVFFSQIFVPEAWPASFFLDIPFAQNDSATALFVLGDLLLVFGNTELFYIVGDTPFSFTVKRSFATSGCPSPWAVKRVENSALYLSRFALYSFDGSRSVVISGPIDPQFTGLFPTFTSMNYTAATNASMVYYDLLKAIAITFPTASGASAPNDTTWWYFFQRQGWTKDSRAVRIYVLADGAGDPGTLYAFDAANGILRQWDVPGVFTDDGAAIPATAKTGDQQGEDPLATKTWTWFTLRAKPAQAVVTVTAELDQGAEVDTFTLSLARGTVYGTGIYGTSTYAGDFDDFEQRFDAKMRGRAVAAQLDVSYGSFIQLNQMFLTYWPVGSTRRRV